MTQAKILVVGEAPSRWMERNGVTESPERRELAALAGITPMRFDELFECVNIQYTWPRKTASLMLRTFHRRKVVLLGQRVAYTFGINQPIFHWVVSGFGWAEGDALARVSCDLAVCPHPNGDKTWWNKPENRISAREFWKSLCVQEVT